MTTPTNLSDQAIAQAFRDCQVFAAPLRSNEFIRNVEDRARELQAQLGQDCHHDWRGDGLCDLCGSRRFSSAGGVVDDAMVERALRAENQHVLGRDEHDKLPEPFKTKQRLRMRTALCAALGVENE